MQKKTTWSFYSTESAHHAIRGVAAPPLNIHTQHDGVYWRRNMLIISKWNRDKEGMSKCAFLERETELGIVLG